MKLCSLLTDWNNFIKMSVLPKAFYRCITIPIKVPNGIFHRTRTNNSKIWMEPLNIPDSSDNTEKEKWS